MGKPGPKVGTKYQKRVRIMRPLAVVVDCPRIAVQRWNDYKSSGRFLCASGRTYSDRSSWRPDSQRVAIVMATETSEE